MSRPALCNSRIYHTQYHAVWMSHIVKRVVSSGDGCRLYRRKGTLPESDDRKTSVVRFHPSMA